MAEHSHLDQQRRPRGECPACDEAWDRQEARLASGSRTIAVERQMNQMMERNKGTASMVRWCPKILDEGRITHTCSHHADHTERHWCNSCATPHTW